MSILSGEYDTLIRMHLATDIILGSWAVYCIVWLVASFDTKRDVAQKQSLWRRWWLVRLAAAFVVVGIVNMIFQSTGYSWDSAGNSNKYLLDIGALLTLCGVALAVWARYYLGRNWSGSPSLKEEHELVTGGPYALVRHPIYTGILLAIFGSSLASPEWFIVFVVVGGMFIRRIGIEEKLMLHTFPQQYPDYKKHSYALIPWAW